MAGYGPPVLWSGFGSLFRWSTLTVCVLLLASAQRNLGGLTQAEKQKLLAEHNRYRLGVRGSPPLPLMTWHDELARVAQAHADKCSFSANPQRTSQQTAFQTVGENVYRELGGRVNVTAAGVYWDSGWLFCPGGPHRYDCAFCDSHKQVLWRSSTSLGCGAAVCDTPIRPYGSWASQHFPKTFIVVCDYGPAANITCPIPYPCQEDVEVAVGGESLQTSGEGAIPTLCFPESNSN